MASSTQCPFLYQTRTILRQRPRVYQLWQRSTVSTSSPNNIKSDVNTSSSQESNEPPNFLQQKAMDVLAKKSQAKPRSKVSKQKVVSLDDIWKLFESSTSSVSAEEKRDITAVARNHTDTDHEAILELFSSASGRGQNQSHHEQGSDTASHSSTSYSPFSFSTLPSSQTTKSAAVAEIADYLSDQTEPTITTHQQQDDLLTKTAQSIISDISTSFETAIASSSRPDYAIWRVSEEKIFPLIKLLTPSRSSLSKLQSSSSSQPPHPTPNLNSNALPPLSVKIPPSLPLLPLLSRLYPSALLLALRLLYTQAPTSPYISALLPHIKSQGPTSYVLGANTYFYNLLLTLRWDIYSDFRTIDKLLGEMERNGVEFDQGTMEVLKRIEEERDVGLHGKEVDGPVAVAVSGAGANANRGAKISEAEIIERIIKKGGSKAKTPTITSTTTASGDDGNPKGIKLDYGDRGRDWWTRTEVIKGLDRLREWKDVVRRKLEERGLGEVMREGGDNSINSEDDGGGIDGNMRDRDRSRSRNVEDAYVVTL